MERRHNVNFHMRKVGEGDDWGMGGDHTCFNDVWLSGFVEKVLSQIFDGRLYVLRAFVSRRETTNSGQTWTAKNRPSMAHGVHSEADQ